ncbi:OmpA family protein [Arcticibacterium luteifluviistationis]|nr:OmpA family protein [Arcticibacterium luteifluviistationis]
MSINLLDLAKGYLSNAAVGQVSEFLGEDSSSVAKALSGALPTVLGGIMNQASTENGLGSLMGLLNQGGNSGILDNLGGVLGNQSKAADLLSGGSGLLSTLLGNNSGGIIDAIGSFSGLKKSSSSSIMSLVAPLLMGVIGKQVKSKGLGISGLASMLMGQKENVEAAMPAGLAGVSSMLNFGKLGDYKGSVSSAKAAIEDVSTGSAGGGNWMKWLLPILAILAAIWAFRTCSDDVADAAGIATDAVTNVAGDAAGAVTDAANGAAGAVTDAANGAAGAVTDVANGVAGAVTDAAGNAVSAVGNGISALGDFFKRKLPNGVELNIPANGIESKLLSFIADGTVDETTWFNFDRINFATGSSALTAESAEQVKNISDILAAYPKVKLKLGGYTDNTGSADGNLRLSQNRANKVMAAILANGIDASRLAAEGYGSAHPVASNDTEEGKAQNRRIAVRITAK